jgi:hypothetical protein
LVNQSFIKDLNRKLSEENISTKLPPGTARRWEPECGVGRHEERIRKETKFARDHKNLPFSVQKPPKPRGNKVYISCDACGYLTSATSVTVGIICPECKQFSTVTEVI